VGVVEDEVERLRAAWKDTQVTETDRLLERTLGSERFLETDRFDRVQLADVLAVCRRSRSLSEAGRVLFAASRRRKKQANDADRLRKYLGRFSLRWNDVQKSDAED